MARNPHTEPTENTIALPIRIIAERYCVSVHTIGKAIREGKLKAFRLGGRGDYSIYPEDAEAWARGDTHVAA